MKTINSSHGSHDRYKMIRLSTVSVLELRMNLIVAPELLGPSLKQLGSQVEASCARALYDSR